MKQGFAKLKLLSAKEKNMIRKIIHINEEKCNGCGACARACHEGAIEMADGKARLIRDDYCDGLGDCLPECPTGAITFTEREAAPYDEAAAALHKQHEQHEHSHGCPGHALRTFDRAGAAGAASAPTNDSAADAAHSQLGQWPCQIRLVPVDAPYFSGAALLIAADCTAYAYARVHDEYMRGKITLIGCPKLDGEDYAEKLSQIIARNDIKSVTVLRMEVPCCAGLEHAAVDALKSSGKFIPWQVVTISTDGRIQA